MLLGWPQTILTLVGLVGFFMIDHVLVQRIKRRQSGGGGRLLSPFWIFALLVALCLALQPLLTPQLSLRTAARWGLAMQLVGVLVVGAGLALLAWAVGHLGRWHATAGNLLGGQPLIESGPYRYIRHPIFAASICVASGLLLINPSLASGLFFVAALRNAYRAALRDERRLRDDLPGYQGYMERTGRFLPRLFAPRKA